MNREIITLTKDEFEDLISEDSEIYDWVEEDESNFDSEKGFIDITFIVQRISDGKFFQGEYVKGGQGKNWINDYSIEEVFPKQINKVVYE